MTVIKELLSHAAASDSGTDTTTTRGFHVSNIPGPPEGKPIEAMKAVGIPRLGDPHPTAGFLFATDRTSRMIDVDQCEIVVQYKIPKPSEGDPSPGLGGGVEGPVPGTQETDGGTISVGATATPVQTYRDRNGSLMRVGSIIEKEKQVTDPNTGVKAKQTVQEATIQIRQAEYLNPLVVMRVERTESGSPEQVARRFVGTVNSAPLGIGSSGLRKDDPRTWLCTRIDGTSNDGGQTYHVTYEFQYNPASYDFHAVFINPETGQPQFDPDFITGEEEQNYRVYDEADFNDLGIEFQGRGKGSI